MGTLGLGAWTWPSGSPDSAAAHGLLYNWYAVADARGLAPQGWRVPTDEDWEVLATSLGSDSAGVRLKSAFGWSDAGNGTDDLGFSATPAGFRWHTGAYDGQGKYASWWTASDVKEDDYYAWYRGVGADYSHVHRDSSSKYFGFSVRLIRDGAD